MLCQVQEGLSFDITLQDYKWAGGFRKVSAIQVIDIYLELQDCTVQIINMWLNQNF